MGASSEEKTWAMLSHLLTFLGYLFPFVGSFLPPLIIYLMQKDQSRFVAFHALQSLYFQLLTLVAGIIIMALTVGIAIATFGFGILAVAPFIGVFAIAEIVYVIVAGVKASGGELFEYIIVGPMARGSVGL